MGIATRHPAPAALVATALLAVLGMVLFARPEYRPDIPIYNVDVGATPHYTVADVKDVFAEEGFALSYPSDPSSSLWNDDRALSVTVLPKTGTLGFGVDDSSDWYEVVVGNVVVSYGGGDADTLDRVKRAVGALQPWTGRYSPLASPSQ